MNLRSRRSAEFRGDLMGELDEIAGPKVGNKVGKDLTIGPKATVKRYSSNPSLSATTKLLIFHHFVPIRGCGGSAPLSPMLWTAER